MKLKEIKEKGYKVRCRNEKMRKDVYFITIKDVERERKVSKK